MNTHVLSDYFHEWCVAAFGPDYRTKMHPTELTVRQHAFFSGFASYHFYAMQLTTLPEGEVVPRLMVIEEELKNYFSALQRLRGDPRHN